MTGNTIIFSPDTNKQQDVLFFLFVWGEEHDLLHRERALIIKWFSDRSKKINGKKILNSILPFAHLAFGAKIPHN